MEFKHEVSFGLLTVVEKLTLGPKMVKDISKNLRYPKY